MKVAVWANDDQWKEINNVTSHANCFRINSMKDMDANADGYLLLQEGVDVDFGATSKPILINSVCSTLKELKGSANVTRINGWNSFLSGSTWEVSGLFNEPAQAVFAGLGKKIIQVPDEPGFVSPKIISMIINEAFFALEDKISTKAEIDIAMKLGTNYPYGPFEWASLIGIEKIYELLQKLSLHDKRYLPATLLKTAATT